MGKRVLKICVGTWDNASRDKRELSVYRDLGAEVLVLAKGADTDRGRVEEEDGKSVIGLCLLTPAHNYVNSQPVKMFEYMAAGLPFVCSDFPLWRGFAEESGAGFCVDPYDTEAIRAAIRRLLDDRKLAEEMGRKGRECVMARYSWANEEKTLLDL